LIRFTISVKWKIVIPQALEVINSIGFFTSNSDTPENTVKPIKADKFLGRILTNGAFNDDSSQTIILFLTGSGKVMDFIIECYGNKKNKLRYLRKQRDKIIEYLKQKKLIAKIEQEEVEIHNTDLLYQNIKTIPLFAILSLVIGCIGTFVNQYFTQPEFIGISLIVFLLVIGLNLLVYIYYNYLGGKHYGYIQK
jgi:hypothetical protein